MSPYAHIDEMYSKVLFGKNRNKSKEDSIKPCVSNVIHCKGIKIMKCRR